MRPPAATIPYSRDAELRYTRGMNLRNVGAAALCPIGLGCMGMSEFYGQADQAQSLATMERALELGIQMLDTADIYGPHTNERLVAQALHGNRARFFVATKFGIVRDLQDPSKRGICGRPAYVKDSCEASLRRLGVDTIDLYYQHRVDPSTPIEETVGAMAQLVKEGKVRYLGLSEASPETLRRACKEHPIAALQTELSLWSREAEQAILPTCKELGVTFVAYSPLGRGFLTGQIRRFEDFAADDYRRTGPRFQGENFAKNLQLVDAIGALARAKETSASALALAWVLSRGDHVLAIPGTTKPARLSENAQALTVSLTPAELTALDAIAPHGAAAGERYAPIGMRHLNG
jgi:aryl-alcohol dehydrogenase-like predicted oxidoreductase